LIHIPTSVASGFSFKKAINNRSNHQNHSAKNHKTKNNFEKMQGVIFRMFCIPKRFAGHLTHCPSSAKTLFFL